MSTTFNFARSRAHFENFLNYKFNRPNLLHEALITAGSTVIAGQVIHDGNKRLALVGDAAMDLYLLHHLYLANFTKGWFRCSDRDLFQD